MTLSNSERIDAAAQFMKAAPSDIYQAFIDPSALAAWMPPEGMTGMVEEFQPWEGGVYRMTLSYGDPEYNSGKTSENSDVVQATFAALVPNQRIVLEIVFESDDPAYAGKMEMIWTLKAVESGTEVSVTCKNVPEGINQAEHEEGLRSTLANLARYAEELIR